MTAHPKFPSSRPLSGAEAPSSNTPPTGGGAKSMTTAEYIAFCERLHRESVERAANPLFEMLYRVRRRLDWENQKDKDEERERDWTR